MKNLDEFYKCLKESYTTVLPALEYKLSKILLKMRSTYDNLSPGETYGAAELLDLLGGPLPVSVKLTSSKVLKDALHDAVCEECSKFNNDEVKENLSLVEMSMWNSKWSGGGGGGYSIELI